MDPPAIVPRPLPDTLAAAVAAPIALLGLGMPLCPACEMLTASLAAVAACRPDVHVGIASLDTPEEWALRETLLWPLGIHVSRASVPALALLSGGRVVATRQGGGPASVIDAWVAEHLGPAERPVASLTATEGDLLDRLGGLRARRRAPGERPAIG